MNNPTIIWVTDIDNYIDSFLSSLEGIGVWLREHGYTIASMEPDPTGGAHYIAKITKTHRSSNER